MIVKGHTLVAKTLRACGVETVFGVMGDANMLALIDFMTREGGRYIPCAHEGGAVSMADGYSRMSGRVGVASVTHGPAVTNALTALTEAVRARSAVMLLTGDTPPIRNFAQRIDLQAAATAAGADYMRIHSPQHIVDDLGALLSRLVVNGRPTLVDIPVPVQAAEAEWREPARERAGPISPVAPSAEAVRSAARALGDARRPVVVAGRGAALAGARSELVQLAGRLGASLATTLMAKDLFRGQDGDLGTIGGVATPRAAAVMARADCVVAFGVGMSRYTTLDGDLLRDKLLIRCDIDRERLADVVGATVEIVGDARATAEALNAALGGEDPAVRWADTEAEPVGPKTVRPLPEPKHGRVDVREAMQVLDRLLPADRVIVTGCGRFTRAPWRYLHAFGPRGFTHTGSFASIGLGIATSVGAAVAQPEKLVVGIEGDGSAMMGLTEFNTAVRERIPLMIVIVNDGSYGSEYRLLVERGLDPAYSLVPWPEFSELARALGGDGIEVRDLESLERIADQVGSLRRPLLVDLKVDPAHKNLLTDDAA
jgi:acetolactate synthase-1/2/3 large subunit